MISSVSGVYIPSVKRKNGFGHIKRFLGMDSSWALYLPGEEGGRKYEEIIEKIPELGSYLHYKELADIPGDALIVLDQRETDPKFLQKLLQISHRILALDEGGSRDFIPYLADTLPMLKKRVRANITLSPVASKFSIGDASGNQPEKKGILVSFGGEDPAGLSLPVVDFLISAGTAPGDITLIQGPLCSPITDVPHGVELVQSPSHIKPYLDRAHLVVSSFGLTAYEAEAAGCRVLLVNPTEYHEKLSKKAGFPSLGVGIKSLSAEKKAMVYEAEISDPGTPGNPLESYDLFLHRIKPEKGLCPACGSGNGSVQERFSDAVFWSCRDCGAEYLQNWKEHNTEYNRDYFFSQYEAQYGKSYLDDFNHIKSLAFHRIKCIGSALKKRKASPVLLDIGCAYGPFLDAARECDFRVYGTDISQDAAAYVSESLGIETCCVPFPDKDIQFSGVDLFDVVTLWYVIEHFQDLAAVLEKISGMMNSGGVLALSTPHGRGISSLRNRRQFLKNSPRDHFIIWRRSWAAKILRKHGFRVVQFKCTGHHPERFGRFPRFLYPFLKVVSRLLFLGDTFEIYAVKKELKK